MKRKHSAKDYYILISLLISGGVFGLLVFLLEKNTASLNSSFEKTLFVSALLVAISTVFSCSILFFIIRGSKSLAKNGQVLSEEFKNLTEKVHHFRSIVEMIVDSNIWPNGLREYMEKQFSTLSYFDVKEFYKGNSKQAIDFLQQNHDFNDTETLYLELKSLLTAHPKQKHLPENIDFPDVYDEKVVSKWVKHKCGSGLWYYFSYKYRTYKNVLHIDSIFEKQQAKIVSLATTIDRDTFEDAEFSADFISKLGQYMSEQTIPKMYRLYDKLSSSLPPLVQYAYATLFLFNIFGIVLPILFLLLNLPVLTFIISASMVLALLFFITVSGYHFLLKQTKF